MLPRLDGSHPDKKPQDEVLKRGIKPSLKCRLDLALEMDFFRIVGRHVEDGRSRGEDCTVPKIMRGFRECGRRVLIVFRGAGQPTVPGRSLPPRESPRARRNQRKAAGTSKIKVQHQLILKQTRYLREACLLKNQTIARNKIGADSQAEQLLGHRIKYREEPGSPQSNCCPPASAMAHADQHRARASCTGPDSAPRGKPGR